MTTNIFSYRVERGVAVVEIDSPPVNTLGHKVRIALCEGVDQALSDEAAHAVVLICAGRTFFAGADVTELGRPILPPLLADVMARFETSAKPIVSAIHGTALGGGLELALAGHYRVAVPSATVGLPEVALGLLPGAGGTQRMPRLIGVEAAVELIGLGRHVKAPEALALGLIDAIVPEGELEAQAITFAQDLTQRGVRLQLVRDLVPDLDLKEARHVFDRFRAAHPELFIGVKAAAGALAAIEAAVTLPFEDGIVREREISRILVASQESGAQRYLFFADRTAAKLPGAEKQKPTVGTIVHVDDEGDIAAYRRALAACDGETIVATRFVERLADLAAATGRPAAVVGMSVMQGVAQIVIGPETATGSALAAMGAARRSGLAAIFVTPGPGLVLERLRVKFIATIEALQDDGFAAGDIATTGRAFGFADAHLPQGVGQADDAIEQRLLAPMLAEAQAIIAAGIALRASDVDYAAVKAGLWPLWRGGPAYMAERAEVAMRSAVAAPAPADR